MGATEASQGTFSTATTGVTGTIGFLSEQSSSSVDPASSFTVSGGQSGAPYYQFIDGNGQTPDFTSLLLNPGKSYKFTASGVSNSHPFMIGESYGDMNSSLVNGGPLSGSGGSITVTIPIDFNGSLYYFCTNHNGMFQEFSIQGDTLLNDSNFQTAVNLWFDAEANATAIYGHISDWNTSAVTDMSRTFRYKSNFNEDISRWDVSAVTDMNGMFFMAGAFNQPIGDWNVSSVTNMQEMFDGAGSFNQPIGNWDLSSVTNIRRMLRYASGFNQPIGNWDVSAVTKMDGMFFMAVAFNQPIGDWNVSSVTNMQEMFDGAGSFNQPIGNWNVKLVTNMHRIFRGTYSFDQDISDWNVSGATTMAEMFVNNNAVSDSNKGLIHQSFSSNANWPYDWSEFLPNSPPSYLNPLSPLTIAENQPIGTVIGEFNATDLDAGATLTYSLVSGVGDGNNSLFTLETNGTLKTATTFDYESNASTYSIRVQAKDEYNASVEGNFTVTLTDNRELRLIADYHEYASQSFNSTMSSLQQVTSHSGSSPFLNGGERFVAVGDLFFHNNASSSDGINWTPFITNHNHWLNGVGYGGGLYMITAAAGQLFTSADGINFTKRTTPDSDDLTGITYGNGVYLIRKYWQAGKMLASNDGISWTTRDTLSGGSADKNNNNISGGNGYLVFVVPEGVRVSQDGISWNFHPVSHPYSSVSMPSVSYHKDAFYTVSTDAPDANAKVRIKVGRSLNGSSWNFNDFLVDSNTSLSFKGVFKDQFLFYGSDSGTGFQQFVLLSELSSLASVHKVTSGFPQEAISKMAIGKNRILFNTSAGNYVSEWVESQNQNIGVVGNAGTGARIAEIEFSGIQDLSPYTFTLTSLDHNNAASYLSVNGQYELVLSKSIPLNTMNMLSVGILGTSSAGASVYGEFLLPVTYSNDAPTDLNATAPLTVAENQPIGSEVGEFNATNPDANSTLTYHLVSGVGDGNNSLFMLETNGTLKTATTFDYESNASTYYIRVQAKDEFNATVEGNFTVTLLNVDEAPVITEGAGPLVVTMSEDSFPTAWVAPTLGATDAETADSALVWSVSSAATNGTATVSGSGAFPSTFTFAPVADYVGVDSFVVQVMDGILTDSITVNVTVSAVNDSPIDLNSTTLLPIAENQPIGTIVGEFNATDPDVNSTLTYHLVSGAGDGNNSLFTLETNGTLKTAITFDYESNASNYAIRLQAKDEFNATVEGNFTVTLTDIFENSVPTNLNSTASLTFAENQAIGTIVSEFNATDPDPNATLTYYLVAGVGDGNNSLFTMEANGSLKTATPFDFENNASSYSIRVQARDEYNATVEGNFTIVLEDLFEDADLDGFSDSDELNAGTNPADQNSKPGNEFGMLAKYEFDGNASDSSGNNRHGSSEGIVQTPQHDGVGGGGVDFMGNNQSLIVLPSLPIMETSFSIMGWVKADSAGGKVFSVGNSVWPNPSSNENGIFINSESNGSISFGTGDSSNLANAIMPTGKWFHLSAVFNRYSKKAQLYVDGVLQSEVILSGGFEREAFEKIKMPLFELDLSNGAAKGGGNHVVRAQTMDTGTTGGSFSFRVNNGTAGDTFRVWMGEVCVFSAGPAFTGPDHTKQYNDNGPLTVPSTGIVTEGVNFAYPGDGWRTTGSAASDDDDLIEVYFGPGQPTTYAITVGASNNDGSGMSAVNSFDPATGLYDYVLTNDLNASFNSNLLTLQSETRSLGIIYEEGADANNGADGLPRTGVTFTPQFFPSFGHEFNGSLDRFRIYDRFLNPYEIINFYNSEKPNTFPNDLNFTTPLTVAENQPVGTAVGEFNATDPDANATLTYYLVSGAGDGNNSLFTLETNGTLKTATTFDYESNASTYTIRVEARDEQNATVEGNFTVVLSNVVEDFDNDGMEDHIDPDDDNDGYTDAEEIAFGSNPRDSNSVANSAPTNLVADQNPLRVEEDKESGWLVGQFSAVDAEGDRLVFSLLDPIYFPGNAYFQINSDGTLRTASRFNYETRNVYSIRVECRDVHGAKLTKEFTVQITPIDKTPAPNESLNNYLGSYRDSDGDGMTDFAETKYGFDPFDAISIPDKSTGYFLDDLGLSNSDIVDDPKISSENDRIYFYFSKFRSDIEEKTRNFMNKLFPILYDRLGNPSRNIVCKLHNRGGNRGSWLAGSGGTRIYADDTWNPRLLVHELIHVWAGRYKFASNSNWNYDVMLSGFEEVAEGMAYEIINDYIMSYPGDVNSINFIKGGAWDEWSGRFSNYDLVKHQRWTGGGDFWVCPNTTHDRYNIAAVMFQVFVTHDQDFYKKIMSKFYEKINTDSTFRPSRENLIDLWASVLPEVNGIPTRQYLNAMPILNGRKLDNEFYAVALPNARYRYGGSQKLFCAFADIKRGEFWWSSKIYDSNLNEFGIPSWFGKFKASDNYYYTDNRKQPYVVNIFNGNGEFVTKLEGELGNPTRSNGGPSTIATSSPIELRGKNFDLGLYKMSLEFPSYKEFTNYYKEDSYFFGYKDFVQDKATERTVIIGIDCDSKTDYAEMFFNRRSYSGVLQNGAIVFKIPSFNDTGVADILIHSVSLNKTNTYKRAIMIGGTADNYRHQPILIIDKNFDGIEDLYEGAIGEPPLPSDNSDLVSENQSRVLFIEENQPSGSMLMSFTYRDQSGDILNEGNRYKVLESQDGEASPFLVDEKGSFRTTRELNFEEKASYEVEVSISDISGLGTVQTFIIQVVDTFIPIVETGNPVNVGFQEAILPGKLLDKGSSMDLIQIGILVSTDPNPNLNTKGIIRERGFLDAYDSFEAMIMGLDKGQKYFYRTYAMNAEGIGYGVVKDFVMQEHASGPSWAKAQPGAAANWWTSPWFGSFYMNDGNAWIMHSELGWLYPMASGDKGVWLWVEQLGWLWTDEAFYPFLYQNSSAGWFYFYGASQGKKLFYHYRDERWMQMDSGEQSD